MPVLCVCVVSCALLSRTEANFGGLETEGRNAVNKNCRGVLALQACPRFSCDAYVHGCLMRSCVVHTYKYVLSAAVEAEVESLTHYYCAFVCCIAANDGERGRRDACRLDGAATGGAVRGTSRCRAEPPATPRPRSSRLPTNTGERIRCMLSRKGQGRIASSRTPVCLSVCPRQNPPKRSGDRSHHTFPLLVLFPR